MKNLFITLFLLGMSMVVCSQDYYWYRGTKIPLERGCKQYIIYEDDKLSESDKSHITYSEDVFYDEIPNLKWGTTSAHAVINDTAHVHYSTISYRKDGDYYDNLFITHRFYVKLKNQEDLPLLEELAAQNSAEIESKAELVNESGTFPAWYILRCKLDAPKNALELANLFYETTDLFSATEPEMINIIAREFPKAIKSLCDEWNVLEYRYNSVWGGQDEFHTLHYTLKTDTLISNQYYSKLYKENKYLGALREGKNADIYYIPSDSTHEYLLYAFNVHIGDTLKNVWIGFQNEYYHLLFQNVIVKEIQTTNPRTFVLDVERKFINDEIVHGELKWLEGIGFLSSPDGGFFDPLAGGFFYNVLCAYNNGEQVYTSEMGQKYGCYYDGEKPQATTWHCVSVYRTVFDDDNVSFSPATYRLQGDTLFGDTRYKTLRSENGTYWGAVRKTADGQQVYYRPGEGTGKFPASLGKEYLLYDFSVKEGDTVVAYSGFMDTSIEEGTPNPYNPPMDSMVVVSVNVIDGRKHVQILMLNYLNQHLTQEVEWIEGIGTRNILFCYDRNFLPGNNWGLYTLCAEDSEGNILYSFDTDYLGVHNNCPDFTLITNTPPSDTIPLFIKDGPGSSTVEPVDPNQIVAVLQMDVLSIFEYIGKEIGYKLSQTSSGNTPIIKRLVKSDTFHESVAVTLTENGTYLLELTHPDWNYTIVGTFEYMGGENAVINTEATVPSARKILRDGQLLIRKGDKICTLTGIQIQ